MDWSVKSLTSFITIWPPTNRDPHMQCSTMYASIGCGVSWCPKKSMGSPLLESPVRKYTSSISISSMCSPIQNTCSTSSHRPIKYLSNNTSFLIFWSLKYMRKPHFCKATLAWGSWRVETSSKSFSHSFHSIMASYKWNLEIQHLIIISQTLMEKNFLFLAKKKNIFLSFAPNSPSKYSI